jgi:periplasmic copper chaperone A
MFLKPQIVAMLLAATAAATQPSQIQIKDAWARATPGRAENGAAYLTIVSPVPDRLVAVSTPVAKKAELHMMSMEGGVMRMRPLDGIDLAANRPVTLKPGGMHIMLTGLTAPLQANQSITLTLSFEKAGKQEVTAAVEAAGAMGPHHESGGIPAPTHEHQ